MHKKNAYVLTLDDNTIENQLSKKLINIIYQMWIKMKKNNKNSLNNYYMYDHRTNIYTNIIYQIKLI